MEAQLLWYVWDVSNVDRDDGSREYIDFALSNISFNPSHLMIDTIRDFQEELWMQLLLARKRAQFSVSKKQSPATE